MTIQQCTLAPKLRTTYGGPQYNAVKGKKQRIELHRGCPWDHEFCYEPPINEDFPIPKLERNYVEILDMNLLARKDALDVIRSLGRERVNGNVITFQAVCGFDFRFLTQETAFAIKQSRFVRPRLAWDFSITEQYRLKDAREMLLKVGYKPKDLMFFIIVNWRIPYEECLRKLDILKVWNAKVCDCCYDGGYKYCTPTFWSAKQLEDFRARCRKHNQLVNFGLDPEVKVERRCNIEGSKKV